MEYDASSDIDAPPATVWSILTDAPAYTTWDNGVERIDGSIEPDARITLHAEGIDRPFRLRVAELDRPRRMVWSGGMPLGLFKGVRTFTLEPHGEGTRFHVREVFSGPLVGLMARSMPDLQPSFDRFAAGLKAHAEAG